MPYFSRLTDIVTCNLTTLLSEAENPSAALEQIIREMQEGVAGGQRSARTAQDHVGRIEAEIAEQRDQVQSWLSAARDALQKQDETAARRAVLRKQESEDLLAGLDQQLNSAVATRDHLKTVLHALEARLSDALRRRNSGDFSHQQPQNLTEGVPMIVERTSRIDAELEQLRQQLGQ